MANERRLIDSAELISMLPVVEEDKQISLIGAVADVVTMISECQPVDAVEVVRCKDCKYYNMIEGWCDKHSHFIDYDGSACHSWESDNWKMFADDYYCADGKRISTTQPQKEDV